MGGQAIVRAEQKGVSKRLNWCSKWDHNTRDQPQYRIKGRAFKNIILKMFF